MAHEIDAWRVADQLLEAEAGVERHLGHCRERGMPDGAAFRRRVAAALAGLRDVRPPARTR